MSWLDYSMIDGLIICVIILYLIQYLDIYLLSQRIKKLEVKNG